jgi:hypothetical protein
VAIEVCEAVKRTKPGSTDATLRSSRSAQSREQLVTASRGTGSPAGSRAGLAGLRPDRLFLVTGQRG